MSDEANAAELHARFLESAADLSTPLHEALERAGPAHMPERRKVPLAHFLARAVVGQQLSTQAARSIWGRVEAAAAASDARIPSFFEDSRADTLRACGISRNKIRTLANLREAEQEGRLDGAVLGALTHEERSAELCRIWGVGQWTVDMASIFWCRSPDVWPETDLAVRNTFIGLIGRRRKPSKAAARFAPYRSYLALYMWKVADARPD